MVVDKNGYGVPCDDRFSGYRWQQVVGWLSKIAIGNFQVQWGGLRTFVPVLYGVVTPIWIQNLNSWGMDRVGDLLGTLSGAAGSVAGAGKGLWDGAVDIAYGRFNEGHKYAQSRPVIKMDTHEMLNDAGKLKAINKDLDSLKERLDAFVKKITWKENTGVTPYPVKMESKLPNVGKHRVIDRSWEYLERTAKEFESNEREITVKARQLGL
jgi:hypothetical protein